MHIVICTKVKIIIGYETMYSIQIIIKMPTTIGYKKNKTWYVK